MKKPSSGGDWFSISHCSPAAVAGALLVAGVLDAALAQTGPFGAPRPPSGHPHPQPA